VEPEAKKHKLADLRNKNFEEWNDKTARGKPKHLYYMVTADTHRLIACQRVGCPLNTNPGTWPESNERRSLSQLPSRCAGVIKDSEKESGKFVKNVIPLRLQTL
jgi:hypothetical protein